MAIEEHQVRERAYYIWEGEGRVHGRAEAHWLRAEAELRTAPAVPDAALKAARKPASRKGVAAEKPVTEGAQVAKPAEKAAKVSAKAASKTAPKPAAAVAAKPAGPAKTPALRGAAKAAASLAKAGRAATPAAVLH